MYTQTRRLDASSKYKARTAGSSSTDWSLQTTTSLSTVSEPHTPVTGSTSFSSPASLGDTDAFGNPMATVSVKQVAPVDLPLREPLVQRPHEKDFAPLEDIPSNYLQSASIKSNQMNETHITPLYPHFMKKVGDVAATLDYVTIKEKNQGVQQSCFQNMWDGVKKFLSSEKELEDVSEENQVRRSLLFWHRGQKTTSTVPKSHTDYVIATFVREKRAKNNEQNLDRRHSLGNNPSDVYIQDYTDTVS